MIEAKTGRRERTFIGAECAACEEPLEHTLRGERILQLSCGHVSHEACFYEYIKEFESQDCPSCSAPLGLDTTRGGNLDFEKLNLLVRSSQSPAFSSNLTPHETPDLRNTPSIRQTPDLRGTPHLSSTASPRAHGSGQWEPGYRGNRSLHSQSNSQTFSEHDYRRVRSTDQYGQHARNDSGTTGGHSAVDYDNHIPTSRKHDYDVQSMEMSVSSPRPNCKNPIPPPSVTVRSEFPTLSRSRQPQSLTCLVTVEVMDGKWRPDPEDIRGPPPGPTPTLAEEMLSPKPSLRSRGIDFPRDPPEVLQRVTEDLHNKVDNWHGLDFARFGKLILHGSIRVGKDRNSWQDLDCYLFTEMLICVKERKSQASPYLDSASQRTGKTRCTLKGSILIRKHLKQVEVSHADQTILTLSLSVAELPFFHLLFNDQNQLETWRRALVNINQIAAFDGEEDLDNSGTDEDEYTTKRRASSLQSSHGAGRSNYTAPTDYTTSSRTDAYTIRPSSAMHVPLDIVVVIPVSSSMQGLKISLLRDVLRFLVHNLGESDRMGLVTFGSSGGGMPIVGMTSKTWNGWGKVLESIKPLGQKSLRADVVEGANVAMDLLMQRKSSNPLSSILLISDSATSDSESVDFVVSRAEAAKITIHSFGLGLTHKPDTMIELSTRTKATYTYVKDWMMLRECIAGCLGSLQSTSHQNVRLKLRLPEGSTAKFVKINGALQIIKRATGRDAEASLGDLRFGDKRDILVQLAIAPDTSTPEQVSGDPWDTIVSGLEALGGPLDSDDMRTASVEEVPLIQADLSWGDILRQGSSAQLPRPSLLAITMLPNTRKASIGKPISPPIPPHPSVVQRRMELLTSDMLMRALTLVSRNQADRANHLLTETRTILKGLGKGGLPPLPPPPSARLPPTPNLSNTGSEQSSPIQPSSTPSDRRTPSPPRSEPAPGPFTPAAGIDPATIHALDAELEMALEWITHPAVFGRDSRKAVLQAIGVISSQRGFTYRTPSESLWAVRIPGIKRLNERSRDWREGAGDESLMEEQRD
ncbi:von Willebrand and RING finger domain-containing protein [Elsinoe ampelina]|uniref:von Willebrand and RING finger domain-containing protein n=1 Tax=Elsinoe ampelina TaxID=302913 RepID=A0A6A6G0A1_9PEZI|nr:von Willebrand and RING finger domain-containing protein [Elsinoe ampelina]